LTLKDDIEAWKLASDGDDENPEYYNMNTKETVTFPFPISVFKSKYTFKGIEGDKAVFLNGNKPFKMPVSLGHIIVPHLLIKRGEVKEDKPYVPTPIEKTNDYIPVPLEYKDPYIPVPIDNTPQVSGVEIKPEIKRDRIIEPPKEEVKKQITQQEVVKSKEEIKPKAEAKAEIPQSVLKPRILSYIFAHPKCPMGELTKALNIDEATVHAFFKTMLRSEFDALKKEYDEAEDKTVWSMQFLGKCMGVKIVSKVKAETKSEPKETPEPKVSIDEWVSRVVKYITQHPECEALDVIRDVKIDSNTLNLVFERIREINAEKKSKVEQKPEPEPEPPSIEEDEPTDTPLSNDEKINILYLKMEALEKSRGHDLTTGAIERDLNNIGRMLEGDSLVKIDKSMSDLIKNKDFLIRKYGYVVFSNKLLDMIIECRGEIGSIMQKNSALTNLMGRLQEDYIRRTQIGEAENL